MSFFSDVGDTFKRAFANPTKLVSDISTFGATAILRTLPKAIGGGQSGIFSKGSEVFGSTAIGVGTGFVTGGIPGAFVGGATGFGAGVSGAVHGSSGKKIAATSAEFSAITGSVTGAITKTGAAGLIRTALSGSPTLAAGASPTVASSAGGFSFSSLLPAAFLSTLLKQGQTLLPGTSGGSTGVTLNSTGPGTPTSSPSFGPSNYPGVPAGLQTVAPSSGGGAAVATAPATTNWLLYGLIAVAAFLILRKKHGR